MSWWCSICSCLPSSLLGFAGAAVVVHTALNSRLNTGPHGLMRSSTPTPSVKQHGSAFGGLTANTQWYDTTLGLVMLAGGYFR